MDKLLLMTMKISADDTIKEHSRYGYYCFIIISSGLFQNGYKDIYQVFNANKLEIMKTR